MTRREECRHLPGGHHVAGPGRGRGEHAHDRRPGVRVELPERLPVQSGKRRRRRCRRLRRRCDRARDDRRPRRPRPRLRRFAPPLDTTVPQTFAFPASSSRALPSCPRSPAGSDPGARTSSRSRSLRSARRSCSTTPGRASRPLVGRPRLGRRDSRGRDQHDCSAALGRLGRGTRLVRLGRRAPCRCRHPAACGVARPLRSPTGRGTWRRQHELRADNGCRRAGPWTSQYLSQPLGAYDVARRPGDRRVGREGLR